MADRTGEPPWIASRSPIRQAPHLVRRQDVIVRVARISEAGREAPAAFPGLEAPGWIGGLDDEEILDLQCLAGLVLRDQDLVELLAGAHPDELHAAAGGDGLHQVHDLHAGDLGDEDLAPAHEPETASDELDPLLQR